MIPFILWPLYIASCIALNYFKINIRGVKPVYFNSNWARFIFGFACLVWMTIDKGFDPANNFFYQIWKVSPEIIYIVSSFYLFFDPGLNGLRGKRWNYRGKSSGILDRSKIVVYYALKCLCFTGLVYSIITILK